MVKANVQKIGLKEPLFQTLKRLKIHQNQIKHRVRMMFWRDGDYNLERWKNLLTN